MMERDIVEWLRKEAKLVALVRLNEAADEIERLRTEIKGLRAGIGQLSLEINDAIGIILGEDET